MGLNKSSAEPDPETETGSGRPDFDDNSLLSSSTS